MLYIVTFMCDSGKTMQETAATLSEATHLVRTYFRRSQGIVRASIRTLAYVRRIPEGERDWVNGYRMHALTRTYHADGRKERSYQW